jgi:membrane associated rhomboid family serine protease
VFTSIGLTPFIVGLTVLVSVLAFGNKRLFAELLFEPFVIKARGQWHRFITHAFIHANWPHLLVNMIVLYGFGKHVEGEFALTYAAPELALAVLYTGGVLFSALPGYRRHLLDPDYRAVGASGAVSAVLFAYVMMTPANRISFLFYREGLPAWVFGLLYLFYSWYMDKRNEDNVAHDAHFYGAVFGILFMVISDPGCVARFIEQFAGA